MPNSKFTFRGLMAPVFTPFHSDSGRLINLSIIPEYAKYLSEKNIKGVLVNGTTGEGTSLSIDERKEVAESWSKAVKSTKQHLMVQIGGSALKDVKDLAAHAESIGVDSLLCLPELYYKPFGIPELIDYLKEVASAAPKTPLLYYHIPALSMINIHIGNFLRAIGVQVPTFSGVKFTHTDLQEASQANKIDSRFAIFLGSDVLMSAGCTLGLDSFIMTTLNFLSEPALEILEFGRHKRDLERAQRAQELITNTVGEITRFGNWIESMKVAMNLTTNLFVGSPRPPNKLIKLEQIHAMEQGLSKLHFETNKEHIVDLFNCLNMRWT